MNSAPDTDGSPGLNGQTKATSIKGPAGPDSASGLNNATAESAGPSGVRGSPGENGANGGAGATSAQGSARPTGPFVPASLFGSPVLREQTRTTYQGVSFLPAGPFGNKVFSLLFIFCPSFATRPKLFSLPFAMCPKISPGDAVPPSQ